ncbi:translation initiation factor IF-2 [Candidatus Woesebacteria bacterium]|nr:translation initiation factor IF-2 [Candidatus Woesebacteria bacterium]MCD8507186.1 translation initiation factor IF-2 [Candidatus Woesebacteria bacterium]MCD8526819.1 translation initiation factor IF-2 [Candidatus Woesebacteria bacterium]MCD8545919.1 translation initiation factor IF-2 [Candidatus Woesebacteria bacterium]
MAQHTRPPVVAILGHVDHGKTSLLDYIRQAHVAAGEAGGITQHIGAYQAEYNGQPITFIDTPGHAAFSEMRSRGAAATDIAILVVAADDGVKPQTIESIKYIRNAGVPMIVAINKIDLPDASPETVKAQLTEQEIYVTGYGGDTEVVEISAKEGLGIDNLLETILTLGEILELQADPDAPFKGVVIESSRDKFRGSLATVLVKQGTLHGRDPLYTDAVDGSVRTMEDATGTKFEAVGPSQAVEITGFNEVPAVGSIVTVEPQEAVQKDMGPATLDLSQFLESDEQKLRVIVKADVAGSLEAVLGSLPDKNLEVVADGIGDISESDIQLAETSGARIIGFNVKASGSMKKLAQRLGVKVATYRIIYELIEEVEKAISRMLAPDQLEEVTGEAQVLKIFEMRGEVILGCKIVSGIMRKNDLVRLKREDTAVYEGKITSIKQGKTDLDSIEEDQECGIVVATKSSEAPAEGDLLVAYKIISE